MRERVIILYERIESMKKIVYIYTDENTTIESLAKEMIITHKNGFITKATFHGIHFSTECFKSEREIIEYYVENYPIIKQIKKKIEELEDESKKENVQYSQMKYNINKSVNDINFKNPNDILEWLSNVCYFTNLIDMDKTVVQLLYLLKKNHYLSFDEIIDTHILYDEETIPRYLIGQVINCLEELGFIDDTLIEFINNYIDTIYLENKTKQKLPFNRFHH